MHSGTDFRRLSQEGESFPDLLLIDGGKGQLSAVMETFAVLNIASPRDEAHRFAQHYHHMLRQKTTFGDNPWTGRKRMPRP